MIEQLDQKTKERVNKAISNIRLIASRSKRTLLLDATQRAEIVVNVLNEFRQFVNWQIVMDPAPVDFPVYLRETLTLDRVNTAAEQAGNIYHNLSHAKQLSYKEEYKQVFLLFGDLRDYLTKVSNQGAFHA